MNLRLRKEEVIHLPVLRNPAEVHVLLHLSRVEVIRHLPGHLSQVEAIRLRNRVEVILLPGHLLQVAVQVLRLLGEAEEAGKFSVSPLKQYFIGGGRTQV